MRDIRKPLIAAWLSACMVAMACPASAQGSDVGRLKAAIMLNVLRFVTVPGNGDATRPLRLCVERTIAAAPDFQQLDGRQIGERPINVRVAELASGAPGCDIAYVGARNAAEIARISQYGLLLVGDDSSFINAGGAVGLVRFGNQIRFEINAKAARQAGFVISSKLMRLAARVQL